LFSCASTRQRGGRKLPGLSRQGKEGEIMRDLSLLKEGGGLRRTRKKRSAIFSSRGEKGDGGKNQVGPLKKKAKEGHVFEEKRAHGKKFFHSETRKRDQTAVDLASANGKRKEGGMSRSPADEKNLAILPLYRGKKGKREIRDVGADPSIEKGGGKERTLSPQRAERRRRRPSEARVKIALPAAGGEICSLFTRTGRGGEKIGVCKRRGKG